MQDFGLRLSVYVVCVGFGAGVANALPGCGGCLRGQCFGWGCNPLCYECAERLMTII